LTKIFWKEERTLNLDAENVKKLFTAVQEDVVSSMKKMLLYHLYLLVLSPWNYRSQGFVEDISEFTSIVEGLMP
jgi:hypothetical protein